VTALGGLVGDTLTLTRGEHLLFRDLSFEIAAGEVLSVEGPNGAGKTSLLRLIAGFLEQHAGTLTLKSGAISIADPEERAKFVGWLGHHDGLKTQLTPVENLTFFARFYRSGGKADATLDRLGLRRVRELPVHYLSAGQKKRLAFARLLLCARPLWLLDEPLSALDAAGRSLAAELIAQHCSSGGLVVAATHDPIGTVCRHLRLGAA
jgi:heme exporter protein A